jgi:NADH dehydrogenase FAD-containing subunit
MGELLELRKVMCCKHHIDPKDVRNVVVEAMPSMLAMLAEPQRVKAQKYLEKNELQNYAFLPHCRSRRGVCVDKGRQNN